MQLFFLRHGRAVEPDVWRGAEADRPLTPEGLDEMRQVARGLKWLGVLPDAIYTSPYARARQTAEIVADALGVSSTPVDALEPGCDLARVAAVLSGGSDAGLLNSVMMVGHEPDLSTLVGLLIGWHGPARVDMKKASCARVDIALKRISPRTLAGRGTLAWLLRAKQLSGLGA
ncbi:MAG TPA: phosphohistidine phosphatase SixA [Ktedonobacterales bacterium]|nr:phosphohistidine phosphatase SixA [Ktedonobacterales bacterium]